MFYKAQKRTNYWSKIRKKAPKVPDITCPAIDDVLNQLEKQVGKELTQRKYKATERKLEKLRIENEKLRQLLGRLKGRHKDPFFPRARA